jgi:hypothetical protein
MSNLIVRGGAVLMVDVDGVFAGDHEQAFEGETRDGRAPVVLSGVADDGERLSFRALQTELRGERRKRRA